MIPVQNIFYMLTYAFQVLNEEGYKSVATEPFHNVYELYAAILSKGFATQLKRGLGRQYISETDALTALRGQINVSESITKRTFLKQQMICTYDEFSVNSYMNRVIKTAMTLLLREDISGARKKELRNVLVFFKDVDILDPNRINWKLHYNKNNQSYRMLISVCYLVIKGLLQSKKDGTNRLMSFSDSQLMNRLYEKFILEYYRKEHPSIRTNAAQIRWQLDDDIDEMLPLMQTDVMLSKNDKVLIIDAKYYSQATQFHYEEHKIRSGHLYQMFTYVKNKERELAGTNSVVSGMLLYAKTLDSQLKSNTFRMSGSKISVRTLDLDCHFDEIRAQLDEIVDEYLGDARHYSA